eukprot:Opistho-2@32743
MPSTGDGSEILAAAVVDGVQLSCAGQDLEEVPAVLGNKYGKTVERLDLSYNSIRSGMQNLSKFTALKDLILDNNCIGDTVEFPSLPSLQTLSLNKNELRDLEFLLDSISKKFPKLTYLSLHGNAACPNELVEKDEDDYKRYRFYVLYRIPTLKFLDSRAVSAEERKEANRVGQFMRVLRPKEVDQASLSSMGEDAASYTPLPENDTSFGTHSTSFGVSKYIYYGKNSEGNRFIRNHDL